MNHDAQVLNCQHLRSRFLMDYDIHCVVSKIPFDKKCHSEHETFVLVESMATPKCAMLFLVPTSELCPQSPSDHSRTCLFTVKLD